MNCDAFALFALNEEGKAQSIKMKGISPEPNSASTSRTWILREWRNKEKTYCFIKTAFLLLMCILAGNYFTVTAL